MRLIRIIFKRANSIFAMASLLTVISMNALAGPPEGKGGGGGHQNGSGGGQGGFGELGNGCVVFESAPGSGTIHRDNGRPPEPESGYIEYAYCNGEDGQVSIPSLLRMDTKKFNNYDRKYWVHAACLSGYSSSNKAAANLCGGSAVEGMTFQTLNGFDEDSNAWIGALDLPEMVDGLVRRVELTVDLGRKKGNLRFTDADHGCTGFSGPVWVRCEGDDNGDSLCDNWTLSTFQLFIDGTASGTINTHACLVDDDNVVVDKVRADFTIVVCALGASDSCG